MRTSRQRNSAGQTKTRTHRVRSSGGNPSLENATYGSRCETASSSSRRVRKSYLDNCTPERGRKGVKGVPAAIGHRPESVEAFHRAQTGLIRYMLVMPAAATRPLTC